MTAANARLDRRGDVLVRPQSRLRVLVVALDGAEQGAAHTQAAAVVAGFSEALGCKAAGSDTHARLTYLVCLVCRALPWVSPGRDVGGSGVVHFLNVHGKQGAPTPAD